MKKKTTQKTLAQAINIHKTERESLIEKKASIDARINQLDIEIHALTLSIDVVERLPDNFVSTPQGGTLTEQIVGLALQTLSERGPLHRRELLEIALQSGIVIGSEGKDQLNTFMSYLSRDERFKSMGRGVWCLTDVGVSEDPETEAEDDEEGGVLLRMPAQM